MPDRRGTVILTRERAGDDPLRAALRERGLEVLDLPCVRTESLPDPRPLAAALRALGANDLLVLTSLSGVAAVGSALGGEGVRAPVAAVGPATAREARTAGMVVTFVGRGDGRSLADEVPLPSGKVLLARSDRALRDLPERLAARGARVREVVAYLTVVGLSADGAAAATRAARRGAACAVVMSPSAFEGLLGAIPAETLGALRLVAIGPTTAAAVRASLQVDAVVAGSPRPADVVRAVELAIPWEVHA